VNEPDVQRARKREVRGVLLSTGHAFARADPRDRLADGVINHVSTPLRQVPENQSPIREKAKGRREK
jgi:hypothetical protein